MWTSEVSGFGGAHRYVLRESDAILTWRQVIERWRDPAFADWFGDVLAESVWPAFFWECPPVIAARIDDPFAFVLVQSAALDGATVDPSPFSRRFRADRRVVVFDNLSGDARLVAPCPGSDPASRAHLAAFVRGGSVEDQRALWGAVATAVARVLDERPLWLSTSGLGVYWLHIRLDRRPKYYTCAPYRSVHWAR